MIFTTINIQYFSAVFSSKHNETATKRFESKIKYLNDSA